MSPVPARIVTAAMGVIDQGDGAHGRQVVEHPHYVLGDDGTILSVHEGPPPAEHELGQARAANPPLIEDLGPSLVLPGFVNAHSHAFQRAIRGRTQRRGVGDPSSFWSWRDAMYQTANGLDPDAFELATRRCFAEMKAAGITCVGEFHYLHHAPDGTPYDDPNELSRRVIAAARAVGIRLSLLEVFYARSGPGSAPLPEQRRFCDADISAYLARMERLRASMAADRAAGATGEVTLGIVPHSVRAVGLEDLRELAAAAKRWSMPVHAHVSEQPAENDACRGEHGKSPTQVFADAGCLDRPRTFTAVHGIFIDATDRALLANQHVCACPTTEADLGDGVVPAADLLGGGTTLALGSDSNAIIDLVQEARLLEMDERLQHGARLRLVDDQGLLAPRLLAAMTTGGASSLGQPRLGRLAPASPFDAVIIDLRHRTLADLELPPALVLDALLTCGTADVVREVFVGGERSR